MSKKNGNTSIVPSGEPSLTSPFSSELAEAFFNAFSDPTYSSSSLIKSPKINKKICQTKHHLIKTIPFEDEKEKQTQLLKNGISNSCLMISFNKTIICRFSCSSYSSNNKLKNQNVGTPIHINQFDLHQNSNAAHHSNVLKWIRQLSIRLNIQNSNIKNQINKEKGNSSKQINQHRHHQHLHNSKNIKSFDNFGFNAIDRPRNFSTTIKKNKQIECTSYKEFLVPINYKLDPYLFNDPRFKQGKHQTVMRMQGYTISTIPFVKPKKLKEELNEQFRETHPWLPTSMTLSKIRNLKADIFGLLKQVRVLDISTVACAWVYFERLIIKGVVHKTNRKLYAVACLVLAYKFNQHLGSDKLREIADCFPKLDRKENLSPTEVFQVEFQVFSLLEFSLHISLKDVYPHIQQFLESKDLSVDDVYVYSTQSLMPYQMDIFKTLEEEK